MESKFKYFIRSNFWNFNRFFVKIIVRYWFRYSVEKNSDKIPKAPFVLIANHANFFDPWMVGSLYNKALFIMMNDDGFRSKSFISKYLGAVGAFAKKKGAHDYKAMKKTLNLLRGGFPVMIFPEGQTSWNGETQPVYGGIEKIIKRGNCSLVMMNLKGNFVSFPWWAKTKRRGKVSIHIKTIDKNSLKRISDEELLISIKNYIYNNDIKYNLENNIIFEGKNLALGLENFVWMCPHCKSEDKLTTNGNNISCSECKSVWNINPNCVLKADKSDTTEIGDLHDWSIWHKNQVTDKITNANMDEILTYNENVVLQTEDNNRMFTDKSIGRLTLTPVTVKFTPKNGDELRWVRSEISDYVIQKRNILEFRADGIYYRYVFKNHSPMKWIYYLRYLDGYNKIEKRGYY